MSKLKCVAHERRVHVWDDGLGAVTVHRDDGSRCIVNPYLRMGDVVITSIEVANYWGGYSYLQDTIKGCAL